MNKKILTYLKLPSFHQIGFPPRLEISIFIFILLISGIVQLNAIFHHGFMGQDFTFNYSVVKFLGTDFRNFYKFVNFTNPPGYFALNALITRLTHGIHDLELIALTNEIINLVALFVIYQVACCLIKHPLIRISFLILVAFLPVQLIHTVVLATDAGTLLPFFGAVLILLKMQNLTHMRSRIIFAGMLGGCLLTGLLVKFTFVSTVVATSVILIQLLRRKKPRVPIMEITIIVALALCIPSLLILKGMKNQNGLDVYGVQHNKVNSMSYPTVFFIKKNDECLLGAPQYNDPTCNLLQENKYSYPGLLHLAIFTDILNIFQYDPEDLYIGPRSHVNQKLMSLSTKTALPISLFCVLSTIFCLYKCIRNFLGPTLSQQGIEVVTILGLAWFANIALFLPFIPTAVGAGFWLPRLVLPAIISCLLLLFFCLDQIAMAYKSKYFSHLIFCYVCIQSTIHIFFLWPAG